MTVQLSEAPGRMIFGRVLERTSLIEQRYQAALEIHAGVPVVGVA